MSVTGHKDVKIAQHYGALDRDRELNKESVLKVFDFLEKKEKFVSFYEIECARCVCPDNKCVAPGNLPILIRSY